ncbi:MAG: DUF6431 domain-containing protein [Acidimicrobiales bacterium]
MAIVWPCPLSLDEYLAEGDAVSVPRPLCPQCAEPMRFWGSYRRDVRLGDIARIIVRRARCEPCRATHALLPDFVAHGRLDGIEVIGQAVADMASGAGARQVATAAAVRHTTARDWLRRFRRRAGMLAAGFSAAVVALGDLVPRLPSGPVPAAISAMGLCGGRRQEAPRRRRQPLPYRQPHRRRAPHLHQHRSALFGELRVVFDLRGPSRGHERRRTTQVLPGMKLVSR